MSNGSSISAEHVSKIPSPVTEDRPAIEKNHDRSPDSQTNGRLRGPDTAPSSAPTKTPLQRIPTAHDGATPDIQVQRTATNVSVGGQIHSVFTTNQKRFIVFMASWAGFFSPVSGNIYFPALNPLAQDLNVSSSLINLTLTSYMIFQGLAPTFVGDFADAAGRRPAYAVCFTVYILANIGLALQNSYAALFVLRCFQSTGSSATIAMCSAVVSDVATAAERGKYMGLTLAGSLLGPAIGPVIGGVLAESLGWRAIFWFLMALGSAFMAVFAIFFPETARNQVGNGSVPPKGWNMSLMNYLAIRKARNLPSKNTLSEARNHPKKFRFPNPLRSLQLVLDKENALLLFYNAFLFAAFYDITASIPSQFEKIFHYNELQIGLCYIPFGLGSMFAALTNGPLLDRNFARWCKKLGLRIRKGRNQDLSNFPIEKARLQVAIPVAYLTATFVCVFGWVLDVEGPLAALLVILFFTSFSMSVAFNVTSTLLIDFYPTAPATATAANNVVRCVLGAGATAVIIPMINAMGRGWTFTFLALFLFATSPMLWLIYFRGMKWRTERRRKEETMAKLKQGRMDQDSAGENGDAEVCPGNGEKPPMEARVPEMAGVLEEMDSALELSRTSNYDANHRSDDRGNVKTWRG
ncbi:uncharacterized protein Z518_10688 [Rhinocladiella mackenziei CBS 650.93]|uniref:Major facilitator superfamily (MFS) profile domain-containing protein n=1 Tax=Rhinocladiella mackenziei CBS 650.93 TaxID=1442369 RepID=A0A0D2I924_9EURO|nr:uncharacterized protein Z518_10688 [Rhinocladiella mackenziei CBS 650.93]KIW99760.1 hypothetical protein Z518_10688 [Rhinocladiella mackenziei CBS 650.93]